MADLGAPLLPAYEGFCERVAFEEIIGVPTNEQALATDIAYKSLLSKRKKNPYSISNQVLMEVKRRKLAIDSQLISPAWQGQLLVITDKLQVITQSMEALARNQGSIQEQLGALARNQGSIQERLGALAQNQGSIQERLGEVVEIQTRMASMAFRYNSSLQPLSNIMWYGEQPQGDVIPKPLSWGQFQDLKIVQIDHLMGRMPDNFRVNGSKIAKRFAIAAYHGIIL